MTIPTILVIILLISVPNPVSGKSTPPSSDLPTTQNNKQSKTLEDGGDLNSPSCSPPVSANSDVQAPCLSPPASTVPPPPGDQRANTAFSSHVSRPSPMTARKPTRGEKGTGEEFQNSVPSCSSPQGGRNMRREGKEPMSSPSSTPSPVRTSPLKPYTKTTTPDSSSSYPNQRHHSPNPGHRIRRQTRPSILPLTTFLDRTEGGRDPINPHRIDDLSKCIFNYFLIAGQSTTATWTQHPGLSTSIYLQCGLNQVAISVLLLAHFAVYDTNPELAVVMIRLSFALAVISGYLSSMPMLAPYFAIIMLIVVVIVCFLARVSRD